MQRAQPSGQSMSYNLNPFNYSAVATADTIIKSVSERLISIPSCRKFQNRDHVPTSRSAVTSILEQDFFHFLRKNKIFVKLFHFEKTEIFSNFWGENFRRKSDVFQLFHLMIMAAYLWLAIILLLKILSKIKNITSKRCMQLCCWPNVLMQAFDAWTPLCFQVNPNNQRHEIGKNLHQCTCAGRRCNDKWSTTTRASSRRSN